MTASSPVPLPSITARFAMVRAAVDKACRDAGRNPCDVELVAVSKTQQPPALAEALTTGQRVFGENRVQEAHTHWAHQREGLQLRLIGPLQTNKALDAVRLFDVIETLDREKLAIAIANAQQKTGRGVGLLVQVNTGAEPQKAGVLPHQTEALIRRARDELDLRVDGLMCIPPAAEDPAPHFHLLSKIAAQNGLQTLSMGMSGDYVTAIACGATHVRVGSALFGERNSAKTV